MEPGKEKVWMPTPQEVLSAVPVFVNQFAVHRNNDEVRISCYEGLPGAEPVLRTALMLSFKQAESLADLMRQVVRPAEEASN